MNHILVASPDTDMLALIADRMRAEGYVPHEAAEPLGVMLNAVACDLVLMDEALDPEGALLGALRRDHPELPLMVVTRQGSESACADMQIDLLDLDALHQAATHLLRHGMEQPLTGRIDTAHGYIDLDAQQMVSRHGSARLTALETELVAYLYIRRGRAVSRRELLAEVWDVNEAMQTRTIDVIVGKLRRKLERDPTQGPVIVTVKNIGYAWRG
ncbi:MAG: winged-helix domain-containing protein [Bradymonadia bacterium]